jgi:phenylpyruvate tautomerase PptA (4-oxalocrotonate tautomerase family)
VPNVKIELLEGRTTEQKAAVAKAITEALVLVNDADSTPKPSTCSPLSQFL